MVWDTVAYMWKDRHQLDQASNSFFRVLLSNPGIREAKDEFLWRVIQGKGSTGAIQDLVIDQSNLMRRDIYSYPLKIHANDKGLVHISNQEWENSIRDLLKGH